MQPGRGDSLGESQDGPQRRRQGRGVMLEHGGVLNWGWGVPGAAPEERMGWLP